MCVHAPSPPVWIIIARYPRLTFPGVSEQTSKPNVNSVWCEIVSASGGRPCLLMSQIFTVKSYEHVATMFPRKGSHFTLRTACEWPLITVTGEDSCLMSHCLMLVSTPAVNRAFWSYLLQSQVRSSPAQQWMKALLWGGAVESQSRSVPSPIVQRAQATKSLQQT